MTRDDLGVRACSAGDAGALAEMYATDRAEIEAADPGRPAAFFEVDGQLDRINRIWPDSQSFGFVAVEGERIVGLIVIEDVTEGSATVGYYVASDLRRAGVATRALGRVVDIAFRELGLHRLVADILPDNAASRRVVERNGFHDEGVTSLEGIEHRRWAIDAAPDRS
jgi:ribosomal-protein-alanine N-acetyltransferase